MRPAAGRPQTAPGWEVLPIRQLITCGRLGGNYKNTTQVTSRPLIKMGNIGRGEIDTSRLEYIPDSERVDEAHTLRYGDVLFNTRNTLDLVGKVAIWRAKLPVAYYNSNIMRLEFDEKFCGSSLYFGYALNSSRAISAIRELATGTTSVAAVYGRDLMKLTLLVPSKAEQCRIVNMLNDVTAMIDVGENLMAKKQAMKLGMMQQLLTGRTRLPGFTGDWGVVPLLDLVSIRSGQVDPRLPKYRDLVLIAPDHVEVGTGRLLARVSAADQQAISGKYLVEPGDVVYGKINPHLKKLILAEEASLCSADMYPLSARPGIDAAYVFYHLLSEPFTRFAVSLSRRSGIPKVNREELRGYRMPAPSYEEQKAISGVLRDADAEIGALERCLGAIRGIRQGMMQELLTGRTRLLSEEVRA